MEGGVPNPTSGGGALTAWVVATQLAHAGHETTCVVLHGAEYHDPQSATLEQRVAALEAIGVEVRSLISDAATVRDEASRKLGARLARLRRPSDAELYPHVVDAEAVRTVVDGLAPDAVFVYHFEALAASRLISAPRVAAVGDPTHLPTIYRLRRELPARRAFRQLASQRGRFRSQPRLMVEMLNECVTSGAFAAHHAQWLRAQGAAGCEYLRTPVPDPGLLPDDAPTDGPIRILLLGHLRGAATLDGLDVFARMLPELERRVGPDGFEARIVGGTAGLPAALPKALTNPAVSFLGHTSDPTGELQRAHCLLVPTSIPLGVRVRILTGLAHGSVIVTHVANREGIPELEDGVNALIGGTARELADAVVRTTDRGLRARLREGARRTYESTFAPAHAAGHIEHLLEKAALSRPAVGAES